MPWALFCPLVIVRALAEYAVFHWMVRSVAGVIVKFARVWYFFCESLVM